MTKVAPIKRFNPTGPVAPPGAQLNQMVDALNRSGPVIQPEITAAAYTLVLSDLGAWIPMNRATAQTLTIPPNSAVPFLKNTIITFEQRGAGVTTFTAGAGVTLHSNGGLVASNGQYAVSSLIKLDDDNTWLLMGNLA